MKEVEEIVGLEGVFCIGGYISIFVDYEKELVYNFLYNFVLIID